MPRTPRLSGPLMPRSVVAASAATVALLLVGCASGPRPPSGGPLPPSGAPMSGWPSRDGPGEIPPPDVATVPDAEPRVEPIRAGGPNKPYEVFGERYEPLATDQPLVQRGVASWYGRKFHGKRTASGELYNMYGMTAAHKTMPLPSFARVRNPANGREVVVRINDRGPFVKGRVIDLSYTAAAKLGLLRGVGPVEVERLTHEQIRTGSWRRATDTALAAAVPVAPSPVAAPVEAPVAMSPPPVSPVVMPPVTPVVTPPAAPSVALPAPAPSPTPAPMPAPMPAATEVRAAEVPGARGFWVQLGAFRDAAGATRFHQQVVDEVTWLVPWLTLFRDTSLHRVQAGPYPSADEAKSVSERVREALRLAPVIVERR